MIDPITYAISFFIGFFLIRFILGQKITMPVFLHVTLSIGLGLGVSGILTFFFLTVCGEFHSLGIAFSQIMVLAILLFLNIRYVPYVAAYKNIFSHRSFARYAIQIILWTVASSAVIILSQQYPFGGWDAWALYNMKAKFLLEGGRNWTDIVRLHWHTQPSYPLLLPLVNAWAVSIFHGDLVRAASATGIIFCVASGLLCYAGLSMFINRLAAFLASLLLLTNPLYIFWGTTQYADVLLAYYLLASMVLLVIFLRTLQPRVALLTGLFWGIMPLAKNEGNVFLFFLAISTCVLLIVDKRYKTAPTQRLIQNLLIGILATNTMNILFKIFMAPPTREVLYNPLLQKLKYFNLGGILTTLGFYFDTMRSQGWMFVWWLIAILVVVNSRKWLILKESLVMGITFCGFLLVLLYVYVATAHFDLVWRLECTAARISFYLLPAAIFFTFYTFWTNNTKDQ